MRYYLIAGEASGDLHASRLITELRHLDPQGTFRGWGGDLMQASGMYLVKHYRHLAFMGFAEVIAHLPTILKNIRLAKKEIDAFKPDALILVDYPGFNLRIASYARERNIRVFYYISPQIWAWKQSRVHQIKRDVDRMFVILPFEKEFYARFNYEVDFPGHPLPEAIASFQPPSESEFRQANHLDQRRIVAVLPGSRRQEVKKVLPLMLSMQQHFPGVQFVVAAAPGLPDDFLNSLGKSQNITIVRNQTYSLLAHSQAALVTSGTASLETALFGVPEVICYKGSWISYHIARKLIKVKHIGLANLIMDRPVIKELIQGDFNATNLRAELHNLLFNQETRQRMASDYQALREKLGETGVMQRTARMMFDRLKNHPK